MIASIYDEDSFGWFSIPSGGSLVGRPWIDIQDTSMAFLNLTFYKVSSGEGVRFWEDTWIDSSPFSTSFPEFYGLSNKKGKAIVDCWVTRQGREI